MTDESNIAESHTATVLPFLALRSVDVVRRSIVLGVARDEDLGIYPLDRCRQLLRLERLKIWVMAGKNCQ